MQNNEKKMAVLALQYNEKKKKITQTDAEGGRQ